MVSANTSCPESLCMQIFIGLRPYPGLFDRFRIRFGEIQRFFANPPNPATGHQLRCSLMRLIGEFDHWHFHVLSEQTTALINMINNHLNAKK